MNKTQAGFIDIHCHLLPACDDGPADLNESLKMAGRFVESGIKAVIATPHHIPGTAWAFSAEKISKNMEKLRLAVEEQGLDLEIYGGMEIALHKNMERGLDNDVFLALADTDCYLLEPEFQGLSDDIFHAIDLFRCRQKKVILAHPERVRIFQQRPEKLVELVQDNLVQVQVNIGSLLGSFGADARKTALWLHKKNVIHYLASDAHGEQKRRPPTPGLWKKLHSIVGEKLETYCIVNPGNLLYSRR